MFFLYKSAAITCILSAPESRPVELTLEKLAPPPKTGLPAGQPFKQDKKSRVVPGDFIVF